MWTHLEGWQAVVVGELLSLLIAQVLDAQAEAELLQGHRRHVVGHVVNLGVQRKGGGGVGLRKRHAGEVLY